VAGPPGKKCRKQVECRVFPILGASGFSRRAHVTSDTPDWRFIMAERKRVRRNTLERRCLGKAFKRLFVNSPKGVFKMLEKIKRA
jgi:hypothetical protein